MRLDFSANGGHAVFLHCLGRFVSTRMQAAIQPFRTG